MEGLLSGRAGTPERTGLSRTRFESPDSGLGPPFLEEGLWLGVDDGQTPGWWRSRCRKPVHALTQLRPAPSPLRGCSHRHHS